jgi:hypothetical protein
VPVISTRKTVQAIDRPLSLEANSHLSDSPAEIIASTVDGPDSIKQVITDHIFENISFRSDLESAPNILLAIIKGKNHREIFTWLVFGTGRTLFERTILVGIKLRISSN